MSGGGQDLEVIQARRNASIEAIKILERYSPATIGMGSGSTIKTLISLLPRELLEKTCFVSTSIDTTMYLRESGARCVIDSMAPEEIDLYIDSADEVDQRGNLLKGRGGALFREKIAMYSSRTRIVVVDERKLVDMLGRGGLVPIEIEPYAYSYVKKRLAGIGLELRLRTSRERLGPVISDNGNFLGDVVVREPLRDPRAFDQILREIEGVVATGIFVCRDFSIVVGRLDGTVTVLERACV